MTLYILRLGVTKDLLRSMAKEERTLFLALGHGVILTEPDLVADEITRLLGRRCGGLVT